MAKEKRDPWFRKLANTFCNSCNQDTCHDVLKSDLKTDFEQQKGAPAGVGFFSHSISELAKCRGCHTAKLVVRHADDSQRNPGTEGTEQEFDWDEISYPPKQQRVRPVWAWRPSSKLPVEYRQLLWEVYRAIDMGALILVAVGARTIIDRFAVQKI